MSWSPLAGVHPPPKKFNREASEDSERSRCDRQVAEEVVWMQSLVLFSFGEKQ